MRGTSAAWRLARRLGMAAVVGGILLSAGAFPASGAEPKPESAREQALSEKVLPAASGEVLGEVLPVLKRQYAVELKARGALEAEERRLAGEKARQQAQEKARQDTEAAADRLRREAETAQKEAESASDDTLWKEAFQQNQAELDSLDIQVKGLDDGLLSIIRPLRLGLPGVQAAAERLFALATTHQDNPLMLEAVNRRGVQLASALRRQMQPLEKVDATVEELQKSLDQIRRGLPPEGEATAGNGKNAGQDGKAVTPEQLAALEKFRRMQALLTRVRQRVEQALAPAAELLANLNKMDAEIEAYLPARWEARYLTPPSRFFDPAVWSGVAERWNKTLQNFQLRMSVEIPRDPEAWRGVGMRFFNVLLVGGLALYFLHRRLMRNSQWSSLPRTARFRLWRGVLWCLSGLALATAAFGNQGEQYRFLYTFGSLWLIWGEMLAAWGLRCLSLEGSTPFMPLWPLYATSACGVILAYPDLPEVVLSLSWLAVCLPALWFTRRGNESVPPLEANLLHAHRICLWISLILGAVGWPQPGILLLVLVGCLCVSVQLVFGLLQFLNRTSEARENSRAEHSVLVGLLAACIAPLVLLLVVAAMFVWIVALPGGAVLLVHYLSSGVQVGSVSFNTVHLFLILSAFYLTRAAVVAARAFLERLSKRTTRLDRSLISPMQTAITYGLWTLFVLFTLRALGFGLANLAVIAGGLSVGIGFGMQTIVNNFLSGLILIFSRTLHEGDVVDVGTLQGTVRKISIRATTIETFDNAVIFVPNSEFVSNRLINWTRNGRSVRREVQVGVAYGTDPKVVEQLLLQIAQANHLVLRYPQPFVLFTDFGGSTINFTLRYWSDIADAVNAASEMRHEISRVFKEQGIEIAFPQLDVHLVRPAETETGLRELAAPQSAGRGQSAVRDSGLPCG